MGDARIRRLPMALSALVALALAVLPLPSMLESLRPDFLVLVVFYWSIELPRAGGLTLAFMAGVAPGVMPRGGVGHHALAPPPMAPGAPHPPLPRRGFSLLLHCLTLFSLFSLCQPLLLCVS